MGRLGSPMKKLIIVVDDKTSTYGELLSALITTKNNHSQSSSGISERQDDTIEAVVWTEKIYSDNQAQLGSSNKIVFIGKTNASKPVIANIHCENEFSPYGVFFGSFGNKAVIYTDHSLLSKKEAYESFIESYTHLLTEHGTENTEAQRLETVQLVEDLNTKRRANLLGVVNKGISGLNKGFSAVKNTFKRKEPEVLQLPEAEEISLVDLEHSESQEKGSIPAASEKQIKVIDTALQALLVHVWPKDIIEMGIVKVKSSRQIMDQQYRCGIVAFYLTCLSKFME